jgi:hypothetical protein
VRLCQTARARGGGREYETARPEIVDSGSVRDGSRPAVLTRDQQLSKSLLGGKSLSWHLRLRSHKDFGSQNLSDDQSRCAAADLGLGHPGHGLRHRPKIFLYPAKKYGPRVQ